MRSAVLAMALALPLSLSCSGTGGEQKLTTGGDLASDLSDAGGGLDTCTPVCDGMECGTDGCGGSCGECAGPAEMCSENGQCVPFTCKSTKDCPGTLVCAKELGRCVECIGDEDCEGEATCGADHECHEAFPCTSDKDCKQLGLLCDKDAGQCVECFASKECLPEEYCLEQFCVPDLCNPGEPYCDGPEVVACKEDGGGEVVVEACKGLAYCEDGACHEPVCPPGKTWCDGDVLKVCSVDGKSVESETDCGASDKLCTLDGCTACACVPGAAKCQDASTVVECADDCMGTNQVPCGSQQSCKDGKCVGWLCEPSSIFCVGDVRKVCSSDGLSLASEEDCASSQQHCFGGACIDTVCKPNQEYCQSDVATAICDPDGMSFDTEACPAKHFCQESEAGVDCLPWVCNPGAVFCEDNTAKVCNNKGSALSSEIQCGDKVCLGGVCKELACKPGVSTCDGNTVIHCDATGTGFEVVSICTDKQYCQEQGDDAWCLNMVCAPNSKSCMGSKVMLCNADGSASSLLKDCAEQNKGCQGGECLDAVCGNGTSEQGEQCDDGNTTSGDGCSSSCTLEPGWSCLPGSPSICAPAQACSNPSFKWQGHCYWTISESKNWANARAYCQTQLGRYLIRLDSQAENSMLLSNYPGTHTWIGLWSPLGNPQLEWVEESGGGALLYSNWAPGEPDYAGSCVEVMSGGTWATSSCANAHWFVCERADVLTN